MMMQHDHSIEQGCACTLQHLCPPPITSYSAGLWCREVSLVACPLARAHLYCMVCCLAPCVFLHRFLFPCVVSISLSAYSSCI